MAIEHLNDFLSSVQYLLFSATSEFNYKNGAFSEEIGEKTAAEAGLSLLIASQLLSLHEKECFYETLSLIQDLNGMSKTGPSQLSAEEVRILMRSCYEEMEDHFRDEIKWRGDQREFLPDLAQFGKAVDRVNTNPVPDASTKTTANTIGDALADLEISDHADQSKAKSLEGTSDEGDASGEARAGDHIYELFGLKGPQNHDYDITLKLFDYIYKGVIPGDPEVRAKYGFDGLSGQEGSHLLGVYEGLQRIDVGAYLVYMWSVEGTLVENIKRAYFNFSSDPRTRGYYFLWFLKNHERIFGRAAATAEQRLS